jgi:hypothetical protein
VADLARSAVASSFLDAPAQAALVREIDGYLELATRPSV